MRKSQRLRQRCILSSPLLNCIIVKMVNIVKSKLIRLGIGIQIGEKTISTRRYADDLVLITESEGDE